MYPPLGERSLLAINNSVTQYDTKGTYPLASLYKFCQLHDLSNIYTPFLPLTCMAPIQLFQMSWCAACMHQALFIMCAVHVQCQIMGAGVITATYKAGKFCTNYSQVVKFHLI